MITPASDSHAIDDGIEGIASLRRLHHIVMEVGFVKKLTDSPVAQRLADLRLFTPEPMMARRSSYLPASYTG